MGREDGGVDWVAPHRRCLLPIHGLRISPRLARRLRARKFVLRVNDDFSRTMRACAEAREDTWITPPITAMYEDLHRQGLAHAISVWREGVFVGGLYGVALGSAFIGESMASLVPHASKAALAGLVDLLRLGGFTLLDAQIMSDHLASFGATTIDHEVFVARLHHAIARPAWFGECYSQPMSQTS